MTCVAAPETQELIRAIQAEGETVVTKSGKKLAEEWLRGAA